MTYVMTTNSSGDPETYRQVEDRLDSNVDGLIARYAGTTDRGLAVTAVWESKTHADRFAAEHLIPAIRDVAGDAPFDGVTVDFEAFDEFHVESS